MNKSKKIFIITITFLMLVGLTAIAATDIDNNDTTTITETNQVNTIDTPTTETKQTNTKNYDNTNTKEASTSQTDDIQERTNTQETLNNKNREKTQNLKADTTLTVSTFDELNNSLISDTYNNITININNDIQLTGSITINNAIKTLTVNGNGKTINGNNNYCFLNINHPINLTIYNTIITNCNNSDITPHSGGAIYMSIDSADSNIDITNSSFLNNTAGSSGAISIYKSTLTTINSSFINNTVRGLGGAISGDDSIILITKTNLINNKAYMGGAIYGSNANITITQSNLTHNNATYVGGAIHENKNGTIIITNSNLTHNTAESGGAIHGYIYSTITITQSNLTHNNANNSGGAIYGAGITINNSTFTNNNATSYGGAISGQNITITQSNLTHNNANNSGGAIYGLNITITDSNLTHNTAEDGGAIHGDYGNITVTNSNLTSNNARYGGAIHGTDINITQSFLNHNNANQNGGAIYGYKYANSRGSRIIINNNTFDNNNADMHGGAIYTIANSILNLTNSTFTNNNANESGGAIHGAEVNITTTLINCNITNNNAKKGGTIYGQNITITDSNLTHNTAGYGGAINGQNITITNSNLTHNTAERGGAIFGGTGNTIITNSHLTNNNANESGGAIYGITNNITINMTNLTHNTAGYGGAIHGYYGNIIVTNSNLTSNNVTEYGGAIYGQENNITVTNTNLTNNNATNGGGAISSFIGGNIIVTNSNLTSNNAKNGGAINGQTITITQSNLTHNNATSYGGAINGDDITITNSNLTHNTAGYGGAIYNTGSIHKTGNITLNDSILNNNTANRGGAIFIDHYVNINLTEINLTNNTATQGGAIYSQWDNNITIINSTLNDNIAKAEGGAIYGYNNTNTTIQNSNFINNNATYSGGAIYGHNNTNITITQSNLTHNNANGMYEYGGGAIYGNTNNTITITNTNLTHNNATRGGGGAIYGNTNNTITITNTNLTHNTAKGGGAIINNGTLIIHNSTINNNTGEYAGAMSVMGITTITNSNITHNNATEDGVIRSYDSFVVVNSILANNNAKKYGGAIDHWFGNLTIRDSVLNNNTAGYGGAINNEFGNINIHNSILNNNSASHDGGAIRNNGNLTIHNSNITNNLAAYGGAIDGGNLILKNSNITNNSVTSSTGYVLELTNSIITDNIFINNTDNTRDMLFSNAKTGANVDIHDNIYINNYLNNTIITPETSVITDNQDKTFTYEIPVDLREIYNDMVRNGTLRVYVNGVYSGTYLVNDGKATINIRNSELTSRVNEVLLNYTGLNSINKHYANNTATFNLTKIVNTTLSVEAPILVYSEDVALINVTLVDVNGTPLSGEIINVFIDGVMNTSLITNAEGKVVYPFSVSGDKPTRITIAHHTGNNSMYASTSDVSKTIQVRKIAPELFVTADNITAHHESNITIQMVDHEGNPIANKNLTVKISEEGKPDIIGTVTTNSMGLAVYTFTPVDEGVLWVNVTYPGDTRYRPDSKVVEFNKSSVTTNLKIVATDAKINMTNTITVEVSAVNNAKVNGTVVLNIDGDIYNLRIKDGIRVYTDYKSTVAGEKNITANFTSSSAGYGPSFDSTVFEITKLPTTVNIAIVNRTAGNVTVKVTVKPEDNIDSVVDGGNIIIQTVNGNTRTTIYNGTLRNGELTYLTGINESGWIEFATEYFGNDYFDGEENNTGSLEILHANTNTSTFDKTARVGDKITLNATVTDVDGNPVNDGSVTFHIDENKVEEVKVENGVATTDYTLPVTYTKGNYTIKANYLGTNKYNTSSGEAKLSIDLQETTMNVKVLNDTKGNTTIEVTLNSTPDNKPISDADIIITDKNGNPIGEGTTDENGVAIITIDIPIGDNEITITYPDDGIHSPQEETKTVNVTPRESKTTSEITNNTVGNMAIDVEVVDPVTGEPVTGPVNITIDGEVVGNGTLDDEGKATIPVNVDKKGNYTIVVEYLGNDDYNGSTDTLDNIYVKGTDVDVNIVVDNPVVGETEVIVTITDPETGEPIPNAPVVVTLPDGTEVTGTTNDEGTATIPVNLPAGDNDITIDYPGDKTHEDKEEKITIRVKSPSVITVDPVIGIVLDNVTFTANVVDYQGNKVNGGNVVFKVGGKTLTYANGTSIKTPVVNGIAKLSYKAESGWIIDSHPNLSVQATYSGTSLVLSNRSETSQVTIYKRNATVTVSAPDDYVNGTLHINAVVKDQNGSLINDGNLVFKLNGLSLKDENNKGIVAKVVNGKVQLSVKLPFAYSAKKYNLTAVYSNKIYNKATGTNTTTLKAIPTYITAIAVVSDQFSKPVVTGQIYNKNNNAILQGTAVLNIKFDGISYAKKVVVNNGTFSETLEGISIYKPGTHKVEIAVGANSHYEAVRETYTTKATAKYDATPVITNITRNKTTTRVQAKIVDDRNKNAQKDLKITIKINGLSFLVNQTVKNGKVDVLVDTSTLKNRTYNLELVSGANTYYNAGKATTELPKY